MRTIFMIFFVAFGAALCSGCSCVDNPDETYAIWVCHAPIVVRALLTKENQTKQGPLGETYYNVTTKKVFKDNSFYKEYLENTPAKLMVPDIHGDGACGVDFADGQEYLILGDIDQYFGTLEFWKRTQTHYLKTSLCNHNELWSKLPKDVVDGLESGRFVKNCAAGQ